VAHSFDTNVLIYAVVDARDPKSERARELLARCTHTAGAVLLLQALAEFSYVAIRKFSVAPNRVQRHIRAWTRIIPVDAADETDLDRALELVRNHRIAFWDGLMCATASRVGIEHLLTEDLQDGRRFGNLTVVNPFRAANAALIDRILPP